MSVKKKLVTNFVSLASVQGLNFILPLITIPYLLHVLGPDRVGLINFAQAFIQYFILFTDYGFIFVATRDISLAREDNKKLSVIFSTVMLVRTLLMMLSFIVLIVLLYTVPKFKADSMIYILTFGMVLGNVLFPIWFFQGIEKMKTISILNAISKVIFTLGIFVFVTDESKFMYVPIFNSLGYIAIGIIAIYVITSHHGVRFVKPSKEDIMYQLKSGWHIFVSNIMTSLYTTSNVFILGFFASNTIVGYYSSAEKVVKAVLSIITPLVQTVYPHLSRALQESRTAAIALLRKVFWLVTVLMATLSLFVGVFAAQIVELVFKYEEIIPILQILSAFPLILGWANVFAILTMINFDYKKELSRIYIAASIFSVVLMFLLIPQFKQYGTAWTAVLTEAFATSLMAIFLWKKGIHVWKWRGK
ncbi:flippase [Ectobacillus antri]|jgi:PST family polysaccharide transporter|uniref:Flippase n=1 Tax=Ectobacillus antri TaxID=2486280 RepID=A0ABT6H8Z6_9BACI|nr:flippase [Ectobacillus antri]MDG4657615.1 flippase [Ectobacillus antri]MDG5755135.1 flippase [Ectobacillus antri]